MWSEYLPITDLSFQAFRYSCASSRRCRMTLVPRAASSMFSTSKSPAPVLTQRTPGVRRQAGAARFHRDLVGHDEARIEAHAELADELGVLLLVARQAAHELLGAALGDGAQVLDGFLARHADAVVADGERALALVEGHVHREFRLVFVQGAVVDAFEAQLVAGVRRIRDQLAQEDFLVRVERVRDEVQKLGDFGLEGEFAGSAGHGFEGEVPEKGRHASCGAPAGGAHLVARPVIFNVSETAPGELPNNSQLLTVHCYNLVRYLTLVSRFVGNYLEMGRKRPTLRPPKRPFVSLLNKIVAKTS